MNTYDIMFGAFFGSAIALFIKATNELARARKDATPEVKEPENCPHCRYWWRTSFCDLGKDFDGREIILGICRRNAPKEVANCSTKQWPEVAHDDWCGEFETKEWKK